ncbi:spry domain containing socs box protein [Anaeramoeba flamelloides]|uniref:Spry domain containing socs box protein n=1 Tax=Anaeramoeba flamelloides TaxID=1746091 RepID=A0AAV7ZB34_9EUKA|nr:spry domain containing socs box protein [Anaeramoeba flamelloides]KAJ6230308.1 spry domain containing socs box protein [Anaeramoeba flamelloides]
MFFFKPQVSEADLDLDHFEQEDLSNDLFLSKDLRTCKKRNNGWSTVYGQRIYSEGTHVIKIKIKEDKKMTYGQTFGVVNAFQKHLKTTFRHSEGYSYIPWGNGRKSNSSSEKPYGQTFKKWDVIGVHLDMDMKTLSFSKNGKNFGIAYSDIPEKVCLAVDLQWDGTKVSIVC